MPKTVLFFLCWLSLSFHQSSAQTRSLPRHIVVIGVDGMSPDGIQNAHTPNMDALVQYGAHSFQAQAVLPTSSSPNWASMIMGTKPEQHEIKSNAWKRKDAIGKSYCGGAEGETWPTIFRILHEQRPKERIAIFHQWPGFGRLVEPKVAHVKRFTLTAGRTARAASRQIRFHQPLLTFIHFDHVDHAGHAFGHGSTAYYHSVEKADLLIGKVLKAIEKAGIREQTLILLTADHGGKGKGHGGDSPEERTIPWVVNGPVAKSGQILKGPIHTYDTAATLAWLLGLQIPECWIGKSVKEAFK